MQKTLRKIAILCAMTTAMTFVMNSCSDKDEKIELPVLSVTPTSINNVPADSSNYTITVTSNSQWTASVDNASQNPWCTITNAAGDGDGSFTVNIAKNIGDIRTADITVVVPNLSAELELSVTITVEQLSVNNGEVGVAISGITWATRNVNAAGFFTYSPGDCGQYYQYGRKVSGTDASYTPTATAWSESENDPCPQGWRLPTETEILTLTQDNGMTISWRSKDAADNYDVDGIWFGTNAAQATAADPKGCIFLPVAGYMNPTTGATVEQGQYGYYFAGTAGTDTYGMGFSVWTYMQLAYPDGPFPVAATYWQICPSLSWMGMGDQHYAYNLRCVKK
jgi:hypothetical protein